MIRTEPLARTLPRGVTGSSDGTCTVSGPALRWLDRLDRAIVGVAEACGADQHAFPPVIPARDLGRIDYFRSFPHLVTMPVTFPADEAAQQRVAADCALDATGSVPLREHAPVRHALIPAACYPVYPMLGRSPLDRRVLVTTRGTCFRREVEFIPLRRQWTFSMREIVCLGTASEVREFLDRGRRLVEVLTGRLGLDPEWAVASDPFFQPHRNPGALMQLLAPVKHEAVVDELAISSVNLHHDHFGRAFEIGRDGRAAHSGCVAFGLERWLGVMAGRWGPDPARWPGPGGSGGLDV